jgi:hypothetical protein
MLLIDGSFFVGELSLPNVPVSTGGGASYGVDLALRTVAGKNLDVFADKYVTDYLVRLFGRELTQTFLEEIGKASPDGRWIRLRGWLLTGTGAYKASPLACYVYYRLMRDAATVTTQAGEAAPEFDGARSVNNGHKLAKAWNDMVDMTRDVHERFCRDAGQYEPYAGNYTGRRADSLMRYINTFNI